MFHVSSHSSVRFFTRWAGRKICQAWKQIFGALRAFSYTLIDNAKVQIFHCGSRMFTLFLWKKLWEIMINSTFAWLNWTRRYEETKCYHRLKRIISWEILRFLKGHEASYRGFATHEKYFVSWKDTKHHTEVSPNKIFVPSFLRVPLFQCYSVTVRKSMVGRVRFTPIFIYIFIYI